MAFKVEEEFEVQAPVQRVWEYLITPARVVVCLPGAELLESQDDQTYLGAVKVKVGPVAMSYRGVVKFTEMDEQAHQVCMVGEGRETGGAGSAKVTMLSKVVAREGGGSLIQVKAEVDLVGKIVQFGRGMIEEVFRQLFRQFSNCVKSQLEIPDEPRPAEPPASPQAPGGESRAASQPAGASPFVAAPTPIAAPPPIQASASVQAPASVQASAPVQVKPLNPVPMVLHALWAVVARFFLRLFGKQPG